MSSEENLGAVKSQPYRFLLGPNKKGVPLDGFSCEQNDKRFGDSKNWSKWTFNEITGFYTRSKIRQSKLKLKLNFKEIVILLMGPRLGQL